MFFRKLFLPWTAEDCFETEEAFHRWLTAKHKRFTDLRMIFIVLAAIPLIAGYVLDLRPVMLVTIVPLLVVLAASAALDQIEKRIGDPTAPNEK